MLFYEVLQEVMDERGLTISDVAKICNLTDSTVRSIFDRKAKRVSLDVAFSLCRGLDVSLERLNTGDNGGKPPKRLGTIFVNVTTALGVNIPDMMNDLGVPRKTIMKLIDNKASSLPEFQLLEKAYGVPVAVWEGRIPFRVWLHSMLCDNPENKYSSLIQQLNEEGRSRALEYLDDMVRSGKYNT